VEPQHARVAQHAARFAPSSPAFLVQAHQDLPKPHGLVLACSHGGFGQPSPSWASEDGGDTWRRLDPQLNPIVSGDCACGSVYDTIESSTVPVS